MNKQLITTVGEFKDWVKGIDQAVALDFETTGLDYSEMEFEGFSLCSNDQSMYTRNPNLLPHLRVLFNSCTWVMHHAVFDLKCCQKFIGTIPDKIFCTLIGAKLLNENLDSYSLKQLAHRWLKVPQDQIKNYGEVSANPKSKEFADYAMNDAIWTYRLFIGESSGLEKEDLKYISDIEMEFQKVLADMEINGVSINKTKLERFKYECKNILHNIESDMLSLFGKSHRVEESLFGEKSYISPINFGSSKQLIALVTSLNFEIDEVTSKGNPSIGKKYLQKMLGKHEFFDLLWRYRKLEKLNNSFLEPLIGFVGLDGKIRPSYQMVRTGRLSCSNPNLQQLPNPKKEKLEFNHRELFVPEEGNVLIKADYSGQELRVLAEVTKDDVMVSAFQNNRDLHLTTANHIFDLGLSDEALTEGTEEYIKTTNAYKTQRHQAKNGVNFPIVYGATAGRIAADNKVTKEEAQRWLEGFFNLYPKVKAAIDIIPSELEKEGFVRTLFGRKRRFPGYVQLCKYEPNYKKFRKNKTEKAGMHRQAFNVKIQGTSADIGKIAGIMIYRNLKARPELRAKIVLFVHDEYVVECPKEKSNEVAKTIKDCMENAVAFSVKMAVDYKIVENFGE